MSDVVVYPYRYPTVLPPVVPTDLTGLTRWYKADDAASITSSAGSVSQWADKAGGNDNLTQATSSVRPVTGTRTLNGRNVLDFDGSGDCLVAATNLPQPFTHFIVLRSDIATTAIERIVWSGAGNTFWCNIDSAENWYCYCGAFMYFNRILDLNTHVATVCANSFTSTLRWDGTQTNSGNLGDFPSQNLSIGAQVAVAASFDGVIAEAIQYNRVLTDNECLQVETYLATQWGITLG